MRRLSDDLHDSMTRIGYRLAELNDEYHRCHIFEQDYEFPVLWASGAKVDALIRDLLIDLGLLANNPESTDPDEVIVTIEGLDYLAHHQGKSAELDFLRRNLRKMKERANHFANRSIELDKEGRSQEADSANDESMRYWAEANRLHGEVNTLFRKRSDG